MCSSDLTVSLGTDGAASNNALNLFSEMNVAALLQKVATGDPTVLGAQATLDMAVLVDDLVTKGATEPYRMFTSRAEHRLLLREGNADARLTVLGRDLGLVGDDQWRLFGDKERDLARVLEGLAGRRARPDDLDAAGWEAFGGRPEGRSVRLDELLRRPEVTLADLDRLWPALAELPEDVAVEAETRVKYEGYLRRQEELAGRMGRLEAVSLPGDLDYEAVAGLSREVVEKLTKVAPTTLGQAGRISGVTPAALTCLEIHLKKRSQRIEPLVPTRTLA